MSGLGTHVRAERLRQKLTLAQLAQGADLSASALSQIERGLTDPSIGSLRRIASALHVPCSQLLLEPESIVPAPPASNLRTTMLIHQGSVDVEVAGVVYPLCAGEVLMVISPPETV
jgi:transcriptional regulator with XRE-family HTH domain